MVTTHRADFGGARGSNAGDYFHELWAVRQALRLLEHGTTLQAVTLEGIPTEAESESAWDGVDCALLHGASDLRGATRVEIEQLKYSAANPDSQWSVAALTHSTKKVGNNSVVRRLAEAYRNIRSSAPAGAELVIRLVSNQPVASNVLAALKNPSDAANQGSIEELQKAAGINATEFAEFAATLDFSSRTGSRFRLEEDLIATIAQWTDDEIRTTLNALLLFVSQKMLPESAREYIDRVAVLARFDVANERALFPCPSEIKRLSRVVPREGAKEVLNLLLSGQQYVCLHGVGGTGKTTALQAIEEGLPSGSKMIIFDCYGAGSYLNANEVRHRPSDAFVQLANEIAAQLGLPLFLTIGKASTNFARSFQARLNRAAATLKEQNNHALLVVAVDAADNSIYAAAKRAEVNFVHDFVTLGHLESNVRLIVTTRTSRKGDLSLDARFREVPLLNFSLPETRAHVELKWPGLPEDWIEDFHVLSDGNPRVQTSALGDADGPAAAMNRLRPNGKDLPGLFEERVQQAITKSGTSTAIERFLGALVVLSRPIPHHAFAAIANMNEAEINDVCADLAELVRNREKRIGFANEDFEHFAKGRVEGILDEFHRRAADWMMAHRREDAYSAANVAMALYQAGRGSELLSLIENEPDVKAIADPVLRRETHFGRLRFATQFAAEQQDTASAIRTVLVGAEAIKSNDALRDLVVSNPDLAAAFMKDSASRTLLSDGDEVEHHGALLFNFALEDARQNLPTLARTDLRQVRAWLERRSEVAKQEAQKFPDRPFNHRMWDIETQDIAAQIEAVALMAGPLAAFSALRGWRPVAVYLPVARLVIARLIQAGRGEIVQECLSREFVRPPWNLLLIVPLALSGQPVNLALLQESLEAVNQSRHLKAEQFRRETSGKQLAEWYDTVITGAEIAVANGVSPDQVGVLSRLADENSRKIENLPSYNVASIEVTLRAHCLLAIARGKSVTPDTFVIRPGAPPKPGEQDQHARTFDYLRAVTPFYMGRAELIAKPDKRREADSIMSQAVNSFRDESYRISRQLEGESALGLLGLAISDLLAIPDISPKLTVQLTQKLFHEKESYLGSEVLTCLGVLAHNGNLHEEILRKAVEIADRIEKFPATAQEKINGILAVARLLLPFSKQDSKVLFGRAHTLTDAVDMDAIPQLRCLAALTAKAAVKKSEMKRKLARDFGALAHDTALKLSGHEHFPWDSIAEAISLLDPNVALALISRWEDSGIVSRRHTLPTVISTAVSVSELDPKRATAFLPLLDNAEISLLNLILNKAASLPQNQRSIVHALVSRDELLDFGEGRRSEPVQLLPSEQEWWAAQLKHTTELVAATMEVRESHGEEPTVDLPQIGSNSARFITAAEIISEIESRQQQGRNVSARDVLLSLLPHIRVQDRIEHLKALMEMPEVAVWPYETAAVIEAAIKAWAPISPAVREWAQTHLGKFIIDRIRLLTRGLGWFAAPPLTNLLLLIEDKKTVPRLILDAVSHNAEDLDAPTIYEVISLAAGFIQEDDAHSVLSQTLSRLVARIPANDRDTVELSDIPEELTLSLARYLYALMSDCDLRIRWSAVHAVRRLAKFNDSVLIAELIKLYNRVEEKSFRPTGVPFYWAAARLWLLIVLDRIAHEFPGTIASHFNFLVDVATSVNFPHVLVRELARDAAEALVAEGGVHASAAVRKQLANSNSGKYAPRSTVKEKHLLEDEWETRTLRFDFDQMDTLRYWYAPAARMFAKVSRAELTDVAEEWIIDRWKVKANTSFREEPRRNRFPEGSWALWSNSHGSGPTVERFTTYLERHALYCAIGELLARKPLRPENADYLGSDSYRDWLRSELLSRPPFWLADFRTAKPLDDRFWKGPESKNVPEWSAAVDEQIFLQELALQRGGEHTVIHGFYETKNADFHQDMHLRSALVEPSTADALIRALQTVEEDWDYALPYANDTEDKFAIDEGSYKLTGWVAHNESESRLDKKDPLRRQIRGLRVNPGKDFAKGLYGRLTAHGTFEWMSPKSTVPHYLYEEWSDSRDDDERVSDRVRSDGYRLWASIAELYRVMSTSKMDLIVEVQLTRRSRERGYTAIREEKAIEGRYDRLFLIRRGGYIETTEGRIGAWRSTSPGTESRPIKRHAGSMDGTSPRRHSPTGKRRKGRQSPKEGRGSRR